MAIRIWQNLDFIPGRGRVIGWSLGNNDNDNNIGRDYQTVWYGNGNNWNNTSALGDLQMADGPYTKIPEKEYRPKITVFPNPAYSTVNILLPDIKPGEHLTASVVDLSGRPVMEKERFTADATTLIRLDLEDVHPGIYLVLIITDEGYCFVEKLVMQ